MSNEEKGNGYDRQPFDRAYTGTKDVTVDESLRDDRGVDPKRVDSLHLQDELAQVEAKDERLKKWVCIIKFTSRSLGVILALTTIIPLAMMSQKHASTRNIYYNVNGISRTAWPTDTETVYSHIYLSFSVISFVLIIVILLAYFRGIRHANSVALINSWWTGIVLAAHIIVMITGVAVFHAGSKQMSPNGEHRDLWGWTCSPAAQQIQPWIKDMKYSDWCDAQTMAYDVGIANAASATFTLTIYIFALLRKKSKKKVQTVPRIQMYDGEEPINLCSWTPLDRRQSNLRHQCTWSSFDGKEPVLNDSTWAPLDEKRHDVPAQ